MTSPNPRAMKSGASISGNNKSQEPSPEQSTVRGAVSKLGLAVRRIPASQRGLAWISCHDLDDSFSNPSVSLADLGLAKFQAIYNNSASLCEIMKDIEQVCGIETEHKTISESRKEARVRLLMNGEWVSDGVDINVERAKVAAINNSLHYLIRKKHLKITTMELIPSQAIFRVAADQIATRQIIHNSFKQVCQNIANIFKTFLDDPAYRKIEFAIGNLSPNVQREICLAAEICKLKRQTEGRLISCWKANSILHNFSGEKKGAKEKKGVKPILPNFSKEKKVAKGGQQSQAKKIKKPQTASTAVPIKRRTRSRGKKRNKKRARLYRDPDEQVAIAEEKNHDYMMQIAMKECMKLEMSNILKLYTDKGISVNDDKSDGPVWNSSLSVGEQTQFSMPDMFPFDAAAVNPRLGFLQGFMLFRRGLTHRPEYLMRMSALVCRYLCRFEDETESSSEDTVTVRLVLTRAQVIPGNLPGPREGWLSTGKGATFEEAKAVCSKNAVNFLINRGTHVCSHTKWDQFVLGYKEDPDFFWEISQQDIDVNFILSSSHPPISEYDPCWELLENMGWSPGLGLGRVCQGEVNPLEVWKPHSGYTGLGFEYENAMDESERVSKQRIVEEMVVRFKNDPDAWKLMFHFPIGDEFHFYNPIKVIADTCKKLRLNLKSNIYDDIGRKVYIWKHWYQVGIKFKHTCERTSCPDGEKNKDPGTAANKSKKRRDKIDTGTESEAGTTRSAKENSSNVGSGSVANAETESEVAETCSTRENIVNFDRNIATNTETEIEIANFSSSKENGSNFDSVTAANTETESEAVSAVDPYQERTDNTEPESEMPSTSSAQENSGNIESSGPATTEDEILVCDKIDVDDDGIYYYDETDDIDGEYFQGADDYNIDGEEFDHDDNAIIDGVEYESGSESDYCPYDEIYRPPSPVIDNFDYNEEVELGNYVDDDYEGLDGEKLCLNPPDDEQLANVPNDTQPGPSGQAVTSQSENSDPPNETSDVVLTQYTRRLTERLYRNAATHEQSPSDRPPKPRPKGPMIPFTSQYPRAPR